MVPRRPSGRKSIEVTFIREMSDRDALGCVGRAGQCRHRPSAQIAFRARPGRLRRRGCLLSGPGQGRTTPRLEFAAFENGSGGRRLACDADHINECRISGLIDRSCCRTPPTESKVPTVHPRTPPKAVGTTPQLDASAACCRTRRQVLTLRLLHLGARSVDAGRSHT